MREGVLPLVDPLRASGQALVGNLNNVALYPDNLLYLVAPPIWALNAHLWLHLLLAPVALYWLARTLGLAAGGVVGRRVLLRALRVLPVAAQPLQPDRGHDARARVRRRLRRLDVGSPAARSPRPAPGRCSAWCWSPATRSWPRSLSSSGSPLCLVERDFDRRRLLRLGSGSLLRRAARRAADRRAASRPPQLVPRQSRSRGRIAAGRELGSAHRDRAAGAVLLRTARSALLGRDRAALDAAGPSTSRSTRDCSRSRWCSPPAGRARRCRDGPGGWFSLGGFLALGGWNPFMFYLYRLPLAAALRYPIKAWLLVAIGASLLAGLGFERAVLAGSRRSLLRALAVLGAGVGRRLGRAHALAPAGGRGVGRPHHAALPAALASAEVSRWRAALLRLAARAGDRRRAGGRRAPRAAPRRRLAARAPRRHAARSAAPDDRHRRHRLLPRPRRRPSPSSIPRSASPTAVRSRSAASWEGRATIRIGGCRGSSAAAGSSSTRSSPPSSACATPTTSRPKGLDTVLVVRRTARAARGGRRAGAAPAGRGCGRRGRAGPPGGRARRRTWCACALGVPSIAGEAWIYGIADSAPEARLARSRARRRHAPHPARDAGARFRSRSRRVPARTTGRHRRARRRHRDDREREPRAAARPHRERDRRPPRSRPRLVAALPRPGRRRRRRAAPGQLRAARARAPGRRATASRSGSTAGRSRPRSAAARWERSVSARSRRWRAVAAARRSRPPLVSLTTVLKNRPVSRSGTLLVTATTTRKLRKVLVVNRGEIAVRVIRGLRDRGIRAAVVALDRRSRRAAGPARRRGLPHRRRAGGERELSQGRRHRRAGAPHRRRRGPSRLWIPLRERRVRAPLPRRRHRLHRTHARRRSRRWARRSRAAGSRSSRALRSFPAAISRCPISPAPSAPPRRWATR